MGRPFNEGEKETIKNNLLEKGRDLFARKELRKTSVGELTRAVGIAQGSFYAFYNSKEELYFEILESEEKQISAIIEKNLHLIEMTRGEFKQFLLQTIALIISNPFLKKMLDEKKYRALISKIPKGKFQKHLQEEYQFTNRLVNKFQEQEHMRQIKPEILSGLLYALFLLQLHRDEIGKEVFPEMFEFLIDIISDTLINNGKKNFDETEEKYSK
jgi:AcrR family transcriptional regulator